MVLSMNVPDELAARLQLNGEGGSRRALEIFALEGYRMGELSRGKVSELLGLEFNETESFLRNHGALIPLSLEEYQRSSEALEQLLRQ